MLAKEFGFDGIHWLAENTEGSELYINKFNNFYNSGHFQEDFEVSPTS